MREFHSKESRGSDGDSSTLRSGFTLLELLVVMGIMAVIFVLTMPTIYSLNSSSGLTKSAADVQAILTQARTQAMLRDSYVFVGFYESDGSQADTVRPAPAGVGRLWVGAAVTMDGTQGYNLTNSTAWSVGNLTPIGKLRFFDNLHLATNASFYLTSSTSNTVSPVGDPSATNTPFGWPIENSNSVTQFTSGVIQFSPQGTAMLPGSSTTPEYIQIALIPAHGNLVLNNLPNAAVIQVDAVTGSIRTFRP
jgi:prepilin-type N-terminal cleavage/methylation domain-containing protein